jgi:hypothetical protein
MSDINYIFKCLKLATGGQVSRRRLKAWAAQFIREQQADV